MISYAQERLGAAIDDIKVMLPAQWRHTGDTEFACDPAWSIYTTLEAKDWLGLFMARDNERPVGYLAAMLHPHTNARSVLVGTIPTYYAEETANRALVVRRLIMLGSNWLLGKGAKQVSVRTRYEQSAGRLLEALGFVPDEIAYKMVLPSQRMAGNA